MAFIPLTEDQWVFCQILYKRKIIELMNHGTVRDFKMSGIKKDARAFGLGHIGGGFTVPI